MKTYDNYAKSIDLLGNLILGENLAPGDSRVLDWFLSTLVLKHPPPVVLVLALMLVPMLVPTLVLALVLVLMTPALVLVVSSTGTTTVVLLL